MRWIEDNASDWRFRLLMWSMRRPRWVGHTVDNLFEAIEWCERIIYCHHNARVIADLEHRMAIVLCEVTRGMSKPYYTTDAMLSEIADKRQSDDEYAVESFIEDLDSEQGTFTVKELCETAGIDFDAMTKTRAKWRTALAAGGK
jgi:hypothetical protein